MKRYALLVVCAGLLTQVFAADSTRQNQGVYGANPKAIVYDKVNKKAFLIADCAYSCFKSSDSGATWTAAFPPESLKVALNATDTVGWGGGATELATSHGTTVVHTQESGGNLWAVVVTFDGGATWKTVYNHKTFNTWRSARIAQFGLPVNSLQNATVHTTYARRVYVVFSDIIMYSADSCKTWNLIAFPDSTAKAIDVPATTRIAYELDFVGATGDTFFVTGTCPNLDSMVKNAAGQNWNKIKTVYATYNNGLSFAPVCDRILLTVPGLGGGGGKLDTAWCFDIGKTEVSPSGDTILVSEGGTMINFGNLRGIRIAVHYSKDRGIVWNTMFVETAGNNRGNLNAFWDAALPTKMRVFLGSTRYAANLDTVMLHPDSIRYGEAKTPASMDVMIPGALCYIGNSSIGPYISKTGINAKFALSITGLEGVSIYKIAQIRTRLDTVYLATHMGLAYTTKYTDTTISYANKWKPPYGNFGMFDGKFNLVAINPNRPLLVVATNMNYFLRTTNGGFNDADWTNAGSRLVNFGGGGGTPQSDVTGFNPQLYNDNGGKVTDIDFIGLDTILASFATGRAVYGGLMQSFDGGATWSRNTNVPDSTCLDVTVARSASGSQVVYCLFGESGGSAPFQGFIMKSTDRMQTWTRIPLAARLRNMAGGPLQMPPNSYWAAQKIEFAPNSVDTAFLIVASRYPSVSFNGCDSIYAMNPQQTQSNMNPMTAIAVNKREHDSIYFVQGKTIWAMDLNPKNLTERKISEISFGQYFNAMPGEIMYDIVFDDLTMSSSMGFFEVSKNATDGTVGIDSRKDAIAVPEGIWMNVKRASIVTFALPHASKLTVSLFNARGILVQRLANGMYCKGTHSVPLHRERLACGTYIMKLTAGQRTLTQRIVLIK